MRLRRRKGLAAAFMAGIDAAVKLGADFIVNTDADNQYVGADIALLIEPLMQGEADIVIGDRNIKALSEMSAQKKLLQRLGSWVVRQVSGTQVPDTTSGFRAYTREAALRMTIVSEFSYTLESIIQAGKQRLAIAHVPVRTNPRVRPSRLFDSVFAYVKASGATIVRIYAMYEPLKVFSYIGATIFTIGPAITARFIYYYLTGTGRGHVQSLIIAAVLMIVGFQVLLIGLVVRHDFRQPQAARGSCYRIRSLELDLGRASARARPSGASSSRWKELTGGAAGRHVRHRPGPQRRRRHCRSRRAAAGRRPLARDHRRRRRIERRDGRAAPTPPAPSSCGIPTTRATARR